MISSKRNTIAIVDAISIDEVEVFVEIHSRWNAWDIVLVSPDGTGAQLHSNETEPGLILNTSIFLLYDNDGSPYGMDLFDCACAVSPSGPLGALDEFHGALSAGDWALEMSAFSADGVLSNWCLRLKGCALLPPSALACDASAADVELSWVNAAPYDSLDVLQDGALLATVPGDATSYIASGVADGRYVFRVLGNSVALACSAGSEDCRAAVGFTETCVENIPIAAGAPGGTATLPFPTAITISEIDVLLEFAVDHAVGWDVFLTSPFSTTVQLHNNGGDTFEKLTLVWSDSGGANTGASGLYDCDFCTIQPSGPGTLSDFISELAGGDWTLSFGGQNADAVVEVWCLGIKEGCTTLPPTDLACTPSAQDVNLTWISGATYSSIDIDRDGVVIATLPGSSVDFLDLNAPAGPREYRVFGTSLALGCASGSSPCRFDHRLVETCSVASVALGAGISTIATFNVVEPTPIQDVEVAIVLAGEVVGAFDSILLRSPAQTTIALHDGTAGENAGEIFDVTFSDYGLLADNDTSFACGGCRIRPSGPGFLSDFRNELANGDWSLAVQTATFTDSPSLDEWCIRIFESCSAAIPSGLACLDQGNAVSLEWMNGQVYDSIDVFRDDMLIATLPGSSTSYLDRAVLPGRHTFAVAGVDDSLECGSISVCEVHFSRSRFCENPALIVPGDTLLHTAEIEIDSANSDAIVATEVFIDIDTATVLNWTDITIVSPSSTAVQLHAGGGGFAADFRVTYSDAGAPNTGLTGSLSCGGCPIRPIGPGELADFTDEFPTGTWTLEMTTFDQGTLNEWCVDLFLPPQCELPLFIRGDADGNGTVNALVDALSILGTNSAAPLRLLVSWQPTPQETPRSWRSSMLCTC